MRDIHRRQFLAATAGAAVPGFLAGCLGAEGNDPGSDPSKTGVQASFFVFGDVTAMVAGEAATAELLVPIGQHGHGWEPGASVREEIRDADLFVHGMEEFQPWVDDVRGDLADDNTTVRTVDVSSGVDLLPAGGDHGDGEEHHDERGDNDVHHDDHGDDEENGGGHEHGFGVDPHFWMDPLRVEDAVETVRGALVDVDPENVDAYAANATSFAEELADLHDRIGATVAAGSTNAILVAGHDSFQYLGDRYDLEIEALTNVSPDDRPTTRDIERAQSAIETHDLRYVCADPLESQQAAEQLVAETGAESILPLTAMPGLTDEWKEAEWGYVDVMREVNLPTLERALDA